MITSLDLELLYNHLYFMRTILLIEDDRVLSRIYETKLQNDGYNVITAFDGEEGLAKALKEHPDMIILDIMLPKRDGTSVLTELRQDSWGSKAAVVILSNSSPNEADMDALTAGKPTMYLLKVDNNPKMISEKITKFFNK